jgi:hypothetical protein
VVESVGKRVSVFIELQRQGMPGALACLHENYSLYASVIGTLKTFDLLEAYVEESEHTRIVLDIYQTTLVGKAPA